jgi:uncharacterized protein YggE
MSENPAPSIVRPASLLSIGVLLIALAGAFLIGLKIHQNPDPSVTGVVTQGSGSIDAKPDQLKFTVTVSNTAPQTAAAMAKTTAGINKVIAALKRSGVADKDIQTASIDVEPSYDYSGNQQRITGYTSSSSLDVLVRKLSAGGATISAASTAAGNTGSVGNVSMSIGNQSTLIAEARDKAVRNSKQAAEALAKAAGRSVDQLVYVEEVQTSNNGPVPLAADYASATGGTASIAPVPVVAGQQKVAVTVKVRWSLA